MPPDSLAAPEVVDLAAFLAGAFGDSTVAVIHYGSRAQGRAVRPESAFDFFVIVDDDRAAYDALSSNVGTSYSPATAVRLARRLPPNVISVVQRLGTGARVAKCCVISRAAFSRACGPDALDHFCHGRLMQLVLVTWTRDDEARSTIEDALSSVRAHTFSWTRPSLPARFTVEQYLEAALRRSLAGEVRPETGDHAATLAQSQLPVLGPLYAKVLDSLVGTGALVRVGILFALTTPVTAEERSAIDRYFRRSKRRNVLRLFKHVILYEGWLDYVVKKIERSSGEQVELSPRERRWPLVFLWPRFFRFLRSRRQS